MCRHSNSWFVTVCSPALVSQQGLQDEGIVPLTPVYVQRVPPSNVLYIDLDDFQ